MNTTMMNALMKWPEMIMKAFAETMMSFFIGDVHYDVDMKC